MTGARAWCRIPGCAWAEQWSSRHAAGCAGTWHVYEDHYDQWVALFGVRKPHDSRPEEAGERVWLD